MKKIYIGVAVIVVVLGLAIYYLTIDRQPSVVGGDRDEHGCLIAAGYAYDDEVGACIRAFEMTPDIKNAAVLAVESIGESYALTIVSFTSYEESGSYDIMLEQGLERTPTTVLIRKGMVEKAVNSMHYRCDTGRRIAVTYYEGPKAPAPEPGEPPTPTGMVEVSFDGDSTITLYQTISADGIRYANSDESLVFWSKGDSALVLENGEEKNYRECIVDRMSGITVISPNGGESWSKGQRVQISWEAVEEVQKVNIRLAISGSEETQNFNAAIATDIPNTGSYEWEVQDLYAEVWGVKALPTSDAYIFIIEDSEKNDVHDSSDASFGIIGSNVE